MSSAEVTAEYLEKKLKEQLQAEEVIAVDTTLASCGLRFEVSVISSLFEGKTVLARHRMINDALSEELKTAIHALSIKKTLTPAQASLAATPPS